MTFSCRLSALAALVMVAGVWLTGADLRAEDGAATQMTWGDENLHAGRYAEGVGFYRKALAAAGEDAALQTRVRTSLIRALRIVGEYSEALTLAEEQLKVDPKDRAFGCTKGELLTQLGRYEEALKTFDGFMADAGAEDRDDAALQRLWAMRQQVAEKLGKKAIVKATTDHFFEIFNNHADYYHSDEMKHPLILAYIGLGIKDENPKDAFEVGFALAESLIEKRGFKEFEAHLWGAQMANDIYHFEFAAKRYQQILKHWPKLPDAQVGLAQVLLSTRSDINGAKPLVEEALKVNPHHADAHLTMAAMQIMEDDMPEAKASIDKALATNPNHFDALAMLAFYHHDMNEAEKELEIEKRVLALNPRYADYFCSLGELIESKRGFNVAPKYYRRAIEVDPDYWRGYYGLGMNTSRQGAHGEKEGKALLLKAFRMNRFNVWAKNMIVVLDKIIGDEEQQVPPRYSTSKTEHFIYKYHDSEVEILKPYLEEWSEMAYEKQTKLFGFEPEGPLTIELCHSFQDQAARTVGLPNLGALGVCFGKLCTVVSPRESKNHRPFNWRKVMEHEFCHVMTLQMSAYRVPRWYTEAFSTYIENDSRLESDAMMVNAIAHDGLKPIEKMNEYFRENMLMAYVHGRYVIEYIDKTHGFEAHKKALRMFSDGKKAHEVLPEVTGVDLAELNKGQLDFTRDFYATKVRMRPRYDQAVMAKLEGAAGKPDASAQDLAELAIAHLSTGKAELAEMGALKALEKDAKCADAILILGYLKFENKDFLAALKLFEQATEIDPDRSFTAWHRLAQIYQKQGKTSKAIAAYEKARAIYPRYIGPHNPYFELPDLYMDLEPAQKDKAMQVWLDAIEANTEDPEAAKKGLDLAMKLENWEAATKCAIAFIEVNPYEVEVHRLGGKAFEKLGDWKYAAREYHVATLIDDKDVDSFVGLARMKIKLEDREGAVNAVRKALAVDGTHAEAKALLKSLGL